MMLSSTEDDIDPAVDVLDFRCQSGTTSRPCIILTNPSHPVHNFPFDITLIEGVDYNDDDHNGFHIRMESSGWKACSVFIPNLLTHRAVMVKGPSTRSYCMSPAGLYHQKVDCQVIKTVYEKSNISIKADPNWRTYFFLILFHKDLILDNYIFSGNNAIADLVAFQEEEEEEEEEEDRCSW
jgi:hypothetical protein